VTSFLRSRLKRNSVFAIRTDGVLLQSWKPAGVLRSRVRRSCQHQNSLWRARLLQIGNSLHAPYASCFLLSRDPQRTGIVANIRTPGEISQCTAGDLLLKPISIGKLLNAKSLQINVSWAWGNMEQCARLIDACEAEPLWDGRCAPGAG